MLISVTAMSTKVVLTGVMRIPSSSSSLLMSSIFSGVPGLPAGMSYSGNLVCSTLATGHNALEVEPFLVRKSTPRQVVHGRAVMKAPFREHFDVLSSDTFMGFTSQMDYRKI